MLHRRVDIGIFMHLCASKDPGMNKKISKLLVYSTGDFFHIYANIHQRMYKYVKILMHAY